MVTTFTILGSIFGVIAVACYNLHNINLGLLFAALALISFVLALIANSRKSKKKETPAPGGFKITAVGTDDDARLVVKAISEDTDRFATLNDIVLYTNLPLKTINRVLDWLFINGFALEKKGRNGKVYILTPEGKATFAQVIKE